MSADGRLRSSRVEASAAGIPAGCSRASACGSLTESNSSNCRSASQPQSRLPSICPLSTRVSSGAARSASTHPSMSSAYSRMSCPSAVENTTYRSSSVPKCCRYSRNAGTAVPLRGNSRRHIWIEGESGQARRSEGDKQRRSGENETAAAMRPRHEALERRGQFREKYIVPGSLFLVPRAVPCASCLVLRAVPRAGSVVRRASCGVRRVGVRRAGCGVCTRSSWGCVVLRFRDP